MGETMSADKSSAERIRPFLRNNTFFGGLPDSALDALIRRGHTRRYAKGETIFRRGEPGDSLMVVLAGRVGSGSVAVGVQAMRVGASFVAVAVSDTRVGSVESGVGAATAALAGVGDSGTKPVASAKRGWSPADKAKPANDSPPWPT